MKKFSYISITAVVLLAMSIASCNKLDEYNPSGATADAVWTTPQGFITAVNAAYYEQRYWYGKDDGIFMSEPGTDLWFNQSSQSYSNQLTRYDGLSGGTNFVKSTWLHLWKGINQCNAGIDRIDQAGFTDQTQKNQRLGELHFLRAFYYWHVVETWGNVMLRTHEADSVELTATRSPIKDFYDLMISDLEFAKDNLPNAWGAEYSRATKKSALGLLARVYLTRAYYPDADANTCFTKARDYAKEVISRQGEFGIALWKSADSLWNPAYNKQNKESLYTISNSAVSVNYNFDLTNGNRCHNYFMANYTANRVALIPSMAYGTDGSRRLMPTRYLLDLFDETIDARYNASFQEKWYNNVDSTFKWTAATYKPFNKIKDTNLVVNGATIAPKELALYISKGTLSNKSTVPYLAFDRNDIYKSDGKINTGDGTYPALRKFMDPGRAGVTSQIGYADIFVIRFAEMYLIAGEAEYKLGNLASAAGFFNEIRKRAAVPGQQAAMMIDPSVISDDWILEERARELCGEHIRWFDLKRIKRGSTWAQYIKDRNPSITVTIDPNYWLRPISQDEMNSLLNANTEFKQNPGYN